MQMIREPSRRALPILPLLRAPKQTPSTSQTPSCKWAACAMVQSRRLKLRIVQQLNDSPRLAAEKRLEQADTGNPTPPPLCEPPPPPAPPPKTLGTPLRTPGTPPGNPLPLFPETLFPPFLSMGRPGYRGLVPSARGSGRWLFLEKRREALAINFRLLGPGSVGLETAGHCHKNLERIPENHTMIVL